MSKKHHKKSGSPAKRQVPHHQGQQQDPSETPVRALYRRIGEAQSRWCFARRLGEADLEREAARELQLVIEQLDVLQGHDVGASAALGAMTADEARARLTMTTDEARARLGALDPDALRDALTIRHGALAEPIFAAFASNPLEERGKLFERMSLEDMQILLRLVELGKGFDPPGAEEAIVAEETLGAIEEHIRLMLETIERGPAVPFYEQLTGMLVDLRHKLWGHEGRAYFFSEFVAQFNGEPATRTLYQILADEGPEALATFPTLLGDYARWVAGRHPPVGTSSTSSTKDDAVKAEEESLADAGDILVEDPQIGRLLGYHPLAPAPQETGTPNDDTIM